MLMPTPFGLCGEPIPVPLAVDYERRRIFFLQRSDGKPRQLHELETQGESGAAAPLSGLLSFPSDQARGLRGFLRSRKAEQEEGEDARFGAFCLTAVELGTYGDATECLPLRLALGQQPAHLHYDHAAKVLVVLSFDEGAEPQDSEGEGPLLSVFDSNSLVSQAKPGEALDPRLD